MNDVRHAFDYDPFSQEAMRDPLPLYKVLRRDHPVFYSEKYDAFFFSRFADILELLSHVDNSFMTPESSLPQPARLRIHNRGALPGPADHPFPSAGSLGMPVYGQVRRAHFKPLSPAGVEGIAAFVRELADARLDELLPQGRFNLTRDYGGLVSSAVIMRLMGLPLELAGEALDIINSGTRTDPESGGFDAMAVGRQAMEFLLPHVEKRMAGASDGSLPLVDGIINFRYKGRALDPVEVTSQIVCAFVGGIETAPKIVAHGLMELAARPDQLAQVRADLAANAPRVAEEMIRYCAPAQWFMRTAAQPVTVAGQAIRPGQRVFYLVASANRDEREYDNPDEFRWNRSIPRTLAFGYGVHFCIGVHLARMEIRELVKTFLERTPRFHFDMDQAIRPPSSFQWGWTNLPVVVS